MTIRELREKFRLTQTELADSIGVVKQTIIKWEKGRSKPSYRSIRVIEELYKVKIKR